jgi:hypothetical protein
MGLASVHGAAGRDQRLPDHLASEHPLPADLRAPAPEEIDLELLEIEDCEEVGDGAGHQGFRTARNAGMWTGACKPVKLGAEPAG